MARPTFKAPPIGKKKKKKKRGSYSVSKDASGIRSKSAEISTSSGGSVGVSKTGRTKTYSYTSPSGSSVGISRNPHSKGITFTSRIGEESYIDVSTDDQGAFNLGFRKKYNKGGDIEKYKDQVKRKYGGGKL